MQTVNLIQGSKEWHLHRANHFNASDAPAMMGVSKYKTRDQLLHEMATGLTQEVDANTQKLFDNGHKFEALARPDSTITSLYNSLKLSLFSCKNDILISLIKSSYILGSL